MGYSLVIQGLLLFVYIVAMFVLISSVIEESISGVVILIFGIPITVAYLLLALIAHVISMIYSNIGNSEEEWTSVHSECPLDGLNTSSKAKDRKKRRSEILRIPSLVIRQTRLICFVHKKYTLDLIDPSPIQCSLELHPEQNTCQREFSWFYLESNRNQVN